MKHLIAPTASQNRSRRLSLGRVMPAILVREAWERASSALAALLPLATEAGHFDGGRPRHHIVLAEHFRIRNEVVVIIANH
jgi:hypothetical protein